MLSTIAAEKAALRTTIQSTPYPDCARLVEQFLALEQVAEAKTLFLFWGTGREPDTRLMVSTLLSRGKMLCLPRCLPGRQMEARVWTGRERLHPSGYGIPEPGTDCAIVEKDQIDLILVPCLCCDKDGYRLGYGGGYYDRYLANYKGLTVSLCPVVLLQERLSRQEHDIPIKLLVTDHLYGR